MSAQALIMLGRAADNTNNISILAQADDIASPTAGWGLALRGSVLTAFAVDDIGESTAVFDLASLPQSQGQLLHVGMSYADGGNIILTVNGATANSTAMGGTSFVNANVVPWVGASDAAGVNPAVDVFEIVSLMYNDQLSISNVVGFQDALDFGFFNTDGSGNGMANADYVYNMRQSVLRNPTDFVANATAAAQLINQGTTQNAGLSAGNITCIGVGNLTVQNRPLRVG